MTSKKLYLVDGTAQLFRAFFAIGGLTNAEGLPTNAVYGFTTMLRKLLREERPDHLGVAFDVSGPVFRHARYAAYKAHRPPTPQELHVQVPYAKQVCEALGIPILQLQGYEADDLIATYAAKARASGFEVVVVASDKDLLQLVGDGVTVFNPTKNVWLDTEGVRSSFGVGPERVRDVLGLMGDAVDNVPGVPGVGQKTALAIVGMYGDIEQVISRARSFVAAWELRGALLQAIEAAGAEPLLVTETAARLAAALSGLTEALERLLALEPEQALRPRLAEVLRRLQATDPGPIVAQVGQSGRDVVRPLVELKRELKALDKASGKRVWYAIAEHAERARLSKELVSLRHDVPLDFRPESLAHTGGDRGAARRLFQRLGFTSLLDGGEPGTLVADQPAVHYRTLVEEAELVELVSACRHAERVAIACVAGSGDALSCPLLGLALAHAEGQAAYLPLGHAYLGAPDQLGIEAVRREVGPLLADPRIAKVGHDSKRLVHLLRRHGLPVDGWALDTMVAAFLLDSSRSATPLEALAREILGREVSAPGPAAGEAAAEPVDQACSRAAESADLIWRLAGPLRTRLKTAGLAELYDTIDGPLLVLLAEMEERGIRIDTDLLAGISAEMQVEIARLRLEIHELAGVEFNPDSPKQLREVLFERLGLVSRRKTAKAKAPSTDAQTLEELATAHPLAAKLLEYRELAKLAGTYVDALPRLVHPATGRVHTSYDPTGAATGRLSSSDPNLQNIPVRRETGRRVRQAFVPADGCLFLASDYSQIELRVLAHMAGDPGLVAAFRAGEDIHRHTAASVFAVHPDLVTETLRRRAKAVNFGVLYGMSESRLAREQGISRADARRFIQAYFERFSKVREYIEGVRERALRDGAVRTLFGRLRLFPQLQRRGDRALREQALRAAVNTTIQGTAADLMKLAMLVVRRDLARAGLAARILLQVHDELLLEVPRGEIERAAGVVGQAMEGVHRLEVPLVVHQKIGGNWLEVT